MGIIRLAKCLRLLSSLEEYESRDEDIKNKISGNRVYMDFVSIVYRIQEQVANELNYLLFSFILINKGILNETELKGQFINMINKYSRSVPNHKELSDLLSSNKHLKILEILPKIKAIVDDEYIKKYCDIITSNNVLNAHIYDNVIYFIVDMLTNKIINVEYVLIAFDGIPSFGKIQEQRQRRYMRYTFLEFKKMITQSQNVNDSNNSNNSNNSDNALIHVSRQEYEQIYFQVDIKSAIDYVYNSYHNKSLQQDISSGIATFRSNNVIEKNTIPVIDVIDKPYGEGEKILMDKIIEDHKTFGDDKTYVFYSPDGDSVILCLYIYLKIKVAKLTVVKAYSLSPSDRHNEQTQYVNISKLYDNIIITVEKHSHEKLKTNEDRDSVCTDFIFMINMYGNDFIHQIPTMEISTTVLDLMYVYSKFIRDNDYLLRKVDGKIHIDYESLYSFFKEVSDYEQFMMLDTYILDVEDRSRILKLFGNIFPCRYLIDYRDIVTQYKQEIYKTLISGVSVGVSVDASVDASVGVTRSASIQTPTTFETIKKTLSDMIEKLNLRTTVSGKKYGDIFIKSEAKNLSDYAFRIIANPKILLTKKPKFIYDIRPRKNRNEIEIKQLVNRIEKDLIRNNMSIDFTDVQLSNDADIQDFSFDYGNIRLLVPHPQMPTTDKDIDIYLLEWKSGKWMNILNAYPYEIGYDWRKQKVKKIENEMKRYQYDMLDLNNTQLNKMIVDYLKTFSWMVDYYMNTDYESTSTMISTWSYGYERSPFASHIFQFMNSLGKKELKNIMKNTYQKSLVSTDQYLKSDKHRFYIYPQSTDTLAKLPEKYRDYFPNMIDYVSKSIQLARASGTNQITKEQKHERVFDCRMCPYFSKCIFKSRSMTFNDLNTFDISRYVQYKILKRPVSSSTTHRISSSIMRPVSRPIPSKIIMKKIISKKDDNKN